MTHSRDDWLTQQWARLEECYGLEKDFLKEAQEVVASGDYIYIGRSLSAKAKQHPNNHVACFEVGGEVIVAFVDIMTDKLAGILEDDAWYGDGAHRKRYYQAAKEARKLKAMSKTKLKIARDDLMKKSA